MGADFALLKLPRASNSRPGPLQEIGSLYGADGCHYKEHVRRRGLLNQDVAGAVLRIALRPVQGCPKPCVDMKDAKRLARTPIIPL